MVRKQATFAGVYKCEVLNEYERTNKLDTMISLYENGKFF